ncbi:MAG TPA: hypothetical protein VK850_10960 [Candidatus Binatia bacterium]|nr:hypothetical protein [Candidatus Binatia bacterium]
MNRRMMRVREIVTQWMMANCQIDNGFRKVEKTRVAIGLLPRTAAKLVATSVSRAVGQFARTWL